MAPVLTIEMLPVLGGILGLRVCRARATYADAGARETELGAAVALDEALARDKAISEAVERLTMSRSLRTYVTAHTFIIDDSGRRDPKRRSKRGAADRMTGASAAGCHLTHEEALSSAFIEAIELEHLAEWCRLSDAGAGIVAYEVGSVDDVGAPSSYRQVTAAGHRVILSWCEERSALPAVVCLALSRRDQYFYASSASGRTAGEAVEHAMSEIAKMVIIAKAFPASADAKALQRNISQLPSSLQARRKILSISETFERLKVPSTVWPSRPAIDHWAPWLPALGRHVVSVPLPDLDCSHPAWEWFA